jgi:flagellar biosynthesis protein FlhF
MDREDYAEAVALFGTLVPRDDEPVFGQASEAWPAETLPQLESVLRLHDLPEPLCRALVEAAPAIENPAAALDAAIAAVFTFRPWPLLIPRGPVVLVGPPGAGKTTLAAKMAARLRRSTARLASADLDRPGGVAQLREYADALGFAVEAVAVPEPAGGEAMIVDTPGARSREPDDLRRIAELLSAVGGSAVLALPGNFDPAEAMAEAEAFARIGARHLVVTRADLTRRLGGVLAASAAGGLALAGASFASQFAYGLRPLTPRILARRVLSAALDDRRWRGA